MTTFNKNSNLTSTSVRFTEDNLSDWRIKYIRPALSTMAKAKKDIDVQFGEMDIGKSLAHVEWFLMGEGDTYNPDLLSYDVDKQEYAHTKMVNDEQVYTDRQVGVHQMGIVKWLRRALYSTMQENTYNAITDMDNFAMNDTNNLDNAIANDTVSDEQIVHWDKRINNNLGSVEKIKFIQQWLESMYLEYEEKQYIPTNVSKAKQDEAQKKRQQIVKATSEARKQKLGLIK